MDSCLNSCILEIGKGLENCLSKYNALNCIFKKIARKVEVRDRGKVAKTIQGRKNQEYLTLRSCLLLEHPFWRLMWSEGRLQRKQGQMVRAIISCSGSFILSGRANPHSQSQSYISDLRNLSFSMIHADHKVEMERLAVEKSFGT